MSFATQQIELSMCSPQTGLPLTANVYTIEGVTETDGTPRLMSIGQLVMAICLQRASALEDQIIGVMDAINANTQLLDGLTTVEAELVKVDVDGSFNPSNTFVYNGQTISYYTFLTGEGYADIDGLPGLTDGKWDYNALQTVISLVEDKMDSLNTISQDTLIQLQSLTAKRDQTYDLVSNVLKSLNNVLVGNANNL
jgi:hypothetical protein